MLAAFTFDNIPTMTRKVVHFRDPVRIVMLDVPDRRPVEDILCTDAAYHEVFRQAGLEALQVHRPLGLPTEPFAWVSETTIAPWAVYVPGALAGASPGQ